MCTLRHVSVQNPIAFAAVATVRYRAVLGARAHDPRASAHACVQHVQS
jgi:hypothetical protein